MPEVVFFDYWTKGIRHFLPIANALKERGVDSLLLHVGSTRDKGVPPEETIQGLRCRDIRFYGRSLCSAIEREAPKVVLMLNMQTEDRILIRLCRARGIRSVFLMHGIYPIAEDYKKNSDLVDSAFGLWGRVRRIPKYIRLIVQYVMAMWEESIIEPLRISNYIYFWWLMRSPGATYNLAWPHKDAYADKALVYAEVYRRLFVETMKYPADRVVVVGNYNLDPLFPLLNKPNAHAEARGYVEELGVPTGKPAVTYMEGGYVAVGEGALGWSVQTVIDEIREVAKAVRAAGMHLIVKLHPVTDSKPFDAEFGSVNDIFILSNADLPRLVLGSLATLGHTSSTLMIPIACGRPLLVITFNPEIEKLGYYLRQGVAKRIGTPMELTDELRSLKSKGFQPQEQRTRFIKDFITYQDGRSQSRIIDEILKLLP